MTKQDFIKKIRHAQKTIATLSVNELNEADTVFHFGNLLCDVFGYDPLTDISREFAVKSTYCDYAVKIKNKIIFLCELKAMPIQLKESHLNQTISYAMNAGVEWCLLTNCKEFQFYHVEFTKPIDKKLVFTINFIADDAKVIAEKLWYLTKLSFKKNEILDYWNRMSALSNYNLASALLSPDVLKSIKRALKRNTGANLDLTNISKAIRSLFDDSLNIKISVKKAPAPKAVLTATNNASPENPMSDHMDDVNHENIDA